MGILTQKFAFVTAAAIGLAGLGGEVYTSYQSGADLAADYGRAAQCEQKLSSGGTCTSGEQTSVVKKKANEEIRNYSYGAVTTGLVLGFLVIL